MTNSPKNLITLRVIEKKNINSSAPYKEIMVAEVAQGLGQFKDGYIVIASIEEGSAIKNSIISIPSSGIMAVVGASLSEYA